MLQSTPLKGPTSSSAHLAVLFLGTHEQLSSGWYGIALALFSLNFGVPMEPEASELPKGLMLGRDGNIHIRITPLGDVGCYRDCPPSIILVIR